jgi:hypothetical protein
MGKKYLFLLVTLLLFSLSACESPSTIKSPAFSDMFSIPKALSAFSPGQGSNFEVQSGKKVIITDIYIVNLGGGSATFEILEQTGPNSFDTRYEFLTADGGSTYLNFQTGLRLGDLQPIAGNIRIQNSSSSQGNILVRVNGIIVP